MPGIPETIYAGDSLSWAEPSGEYPTPTWTMHYAIRGASALDLISTPSGSEHAFLATAVQTAALTPGRYSWQSYVTNGTGERYTIGTGTVTVRPNLPAQFTGYDGRSHAQKVLDAIEATIEGRASKAQASITINGRAITYMRPDELLSWRASYRREVAREKGESTVIRSQFGSA